MSVISKMHCSELFYLPAHFSTFHWIYMYSHVAIHLRLCLLRYQRCLVSSWMKRMKCQRVKIPHSSQIEVILFFQHCPKFDETFLSENEFIVRKIFNQWFWYSEHFPVVCRLYRNSTSENTLMKFKNLLL